MTNSAGEPQGEERSRRHRAAVRLSRVDAERLARGEIRQAEDALHLNDHKKSVSYQHEVEPKVSARDANERRLLDDRPPHFGSL